MDREIAVQLHCGRKVASLWRQRFVEGRVAAAVKSLQRGSPRGNPEAETSQRGRAAGPRRAKSVPGLLAAIEDGIDLHNENPRPFVWRETAPTWADVILERSTERRRLS